MGAPYPLSLDEGISYETPEGEALPTERGPALSILGFICAVACIYEVTPLARPLAVVFCASLADARDAIYDFGEAPA